MARVVSPMDAVRLAQAEPERQVVFFAIGFETTVPSIAASVLHAERNAITNFSILPANVFLCCQPFMPFWSSPENRVNGFLAAGHVCAVMGYWEYEPIAAQYDTPIVVTDLSPSTWLSRIYQTVRQLKSAAAT